LEGVTGRCVIIIHEKNYSRIEGILAKVMRAPSQLKRPLDDLNSMLWELMDGSRTKSEITEILEQTFHERMIPASHRVAMSIQEMIDLGLVIPLPSQFRGQWDIDAVIDYAGD
jgi:hypothetical protein